MRRTARLSRWMLALLLFLPVAIPSTAAPPDRDTDRQGAGHWGEAVFAEVADHGTWQVIRPDDPAWQRFRERFPGEWRATYDLRSGRPQWIFGPGIDVARGTLPHEVARAFAAEFLVEHAGLFGIEGVAPVLPEPYAVGHDLVLNVTFEKDGIAVDDRSRIGFRFKDHGVLAAVLANDLPVSFERAEPTVSAEAAVALGRAASLRPRDSVRVVQEPALVYLPDERLRARLVWRFRLASDDLVDPFDTTYHVLARDTAAILSAESNVHYVDATGKVEGNVILFDPATAPERLPLESLEVDIVSGGSGSALTDENGDFTIPFGGEGEITVRSRLRGPFVRVVDQGGPNEELMQNGPPPGPFDFLHNVPQTEFLTAQANGHFHTNVVHDFHEAILGESRADVPIVCNVNLNSSCNAFFNGSINFFRESGGCRNTAYDTVVYHEYGHFLDGIFGTVRQPFSEGMADVFAMFITDQPIVGENFFLGGGFIRTGENTRQWPASECGGQVHCVGETLMGFMWKMRVNLKNTLGDQEGSAIADQIAVFMNATDPVTIPEAVFTTFIVDDDDGNLGNGTPNFFDIADAAEAHNFDPPNPIFVDIRHVALDNTIDQVNERPVVASISSPAGEIQSASVFFSLDGGTFSEVAMAPTGEPDEFAASIPAQPCGSRVRYYIEATDARGFQHTHPAQAPASDVHLYLVARKDTILFEDFEGPIDDWFLLPGSVFDQGAPNQNGDNPFDPLTAFSGVNVIGTDLNVGEEDGFYPPGHFTQARSPILDLTGLGDVHLTYRRWLSVQDSSHDRAEILVQDSALQTVTAWRNATQQPQGDLMNQIDRDWTPQTLDISGVADGDAEVKVFFRLISDASGEFGGFNIDDFEVFTPSCDVVKLTTSDPTPSIGMPVTFSIEGGPDEPFWLFSANGTGDGTFQVPGGPLLETGLDAASQRVRRQGTLDGAGMRDVTRNVPDKPALIGRLFALSAISKNGVFQTSNLIFVTIDP